MIQIETLEVAGFSPALHAMRNPMDSWAKSDTHRGTEARTGAFCMEIGPNDKDLSLRLQKAGPEHCKHLRMIVAYADITAPLYWWKQMDCYRAGVEKLSTSTMHTLTKKPLTPDMFSEGTSTVLINELEQVRQEYNTTDDLCLKGMAWNRLVHNLPSGFLQKRTVMLSYAALRSIYRQREGHKLDEWRRFREWVETLPEAWMITE